jgi:MYXO-CTERM domain-containing protein
MNPQAQDALANLRDIHLPAPVSFWPPAPGWWMVAGAALALVAGIWLWRRRRRTSLRRAVERELLALELAFLDGGDQADLAVGLSGVLRRVALVRFDRGAVASLHGDEWIAFLSNAERGAGVPREVAEALERGVYAGGDTGWKSDDGMAWIDAVRVWTGNHT